MAATMKQKRDNEIALLGKKDKKNTTEEMELLEHHKIAIDMDRPITNDDIVPDEQSDSGKNKLGDKIAKGNKVFTNNVNSSPKDTSYAVNKSDDENEVKDLLDDEELDQRINPILYVRGVPSDSFYLILKGKVSITSGHEQFILEQGPFNYMGVDSLQNDSYVPDFNAKIVGKAKLL